MMTKENLKCRRCGGDARLTQWRDERQTYYGVHCESCGLSVGGFDDAQDAIGAWNSKRNIVDRKGS